ncbi:hypothetical protein BJ322DRAFT_1113842 [Thelephora terrestris]|uniref:Pyridoxal phosphate homeostasis protein n=1 Tax=Thelephora terrestris TaxID=56493 RepID=A0A9P6L249_9AGAM|nr:hypothetical protein BJ322DRAFT_1113842 [Thelephora terrestris]
MSSTLASTARSAEVQQQLADIKSRVHQITTGQDREPTLVAVSKYKPAVDIQACYEVGHRHFGENYVQELVEKAEQLPKDIHWHFIGTLQSNKARLITCTDSKPPHGPNSFVPKTRDRTQQNWTDDRESLLNVLIQVNTSGEDSKSGVSPQDAELVNLARFVVDSCPRLYLRGLMTIGSLSESLSGDENRDFDLLKKTRDELQATLKEQGVNRWGKDGELILSMGMSSDFEAALRAGSDIVRVGTGIFGERIKKIP